MSLAYWMVAAAMFGIIQLRANAFCRLIDQRKRFTNLICAVVTHIAAGEVEYSQRAGAFRQGPCETPRALVAKWVEGEIKPPQTTPRNRCGQHSARMSADMAAAEV